jgi:hypothetical protein
MVGKALSLSTATLAFCLFTGPASAAPIGSVVSSDVKADASAVEQVARRCWRHHGRLHCRGRSHVYGYGPSVSIRIGRGYRHHHHRHHRHW